MARDEIRRLALLRDLARRQAPLSLDALRLADRFTLALQLLEQQHGPIELQSLRRMIPRFDPRADPVETAIAATLCTLGIELAQEDEARAELREQARGEMLGVRIGLPDDNMSDRVVVDEPAAEFAVDRHLTRVSHDSAVIATCDDRVRDEELEVDVELDSDPADEWDASDVGGRA